MNSAPATMLKRLLRNLTPTHWVTLAVFLMIGGLTVVFAFHAFWAWAVLGIAAMLLLSLFVIITGFNLVSQRVLRQSRRIARDPVLEGKTQRTGRTGNSTLSPTSGAIWYWVKQIQEVKGQLSWFTSLAIRTRLAGARDVLAYASTHGRMDHTALSRHLESYRVELFREETRETLNKTIWKTALLCLGRVLYSQRLKQIDLLDATTIYDYVYSTYGPKGLQGVDQSYYADLLTWSGRYKEALRLLEDHPAEQPGRRYSQAFLRLNAINPAVTGNPARRAEWLESMNGLLAESGLAPITVRNPASPSFFELTCEAPLPQVTDGPLVTVIMPIYEPDEATEVAVRSLLEQTWRNIEILIIDDASPQTDAQGKPTDYESRLKDWQQLDDRITVVFCEENRGAYAVRNDGYDMARGEFVTVADKDDWHHPQKIEFLAKELIENPEVPANLGNWVRVSEKLEFLVRWGPDRVIHPSFASLMYRREEIQEKLGYWDTVRKSADGEFKLRFELAYGTKLQPSFKAPLAFALLGEGNLTSSDYGLGYRHEDRHAYQRGYKQWHQDIEAGIASPYMPKNPSPRLFYAPPSFLPERPQGPVHYDVIFMSEFGFEAGNTTSLRQEIDAALRAGLKVGVLPVQNGLIPSASRRHFTPKVEELIFTGQVDRLSLSSRATTDLLVVRWPASMELNPGVRASITPERAVIVANHMPYEPSGERRSYDVRSVSENVEATFGVRPLWSPQSEQVEKYLSPLVPSEELTNFAWKGIVDPPTDLAERVPEPDRRPTIGRHARDYQGKWPSTLRDFQRVYPVDGSVRVSILGGAGVPQDLGFLPEELPEGWTVHGFNALATADFLDSLDFFVYYHSDGLVEAFGMSILEALNRGLVCVLPPHFEPVFKEGAVYATPENTQRVIAELWDDPISYAAQSRRALEFVQRECTPDAYIARLRDLGVNVSGR